ncbi:MAG: MgtC/SapB family protein [Anaerolineales bacterium]|nr:MgtC/SapB family protein [Anaerolineales bacterium]
MTGISFLGAGTILRQRNQGRVEGLTTAASLLFAGSIGMSIAFAQGLLAIATKGVVLLTLRVIPSVPSIFRRKE